jgi:hypothetical protein
MCSVITDEYLICHFKSISNICRIPSRFASKENTQENEKRGSTSEVLPNLYQAGALEASDRKEIFFHTLNHLTTYPLNTIATYLIHGLARLDIRMDVLLAQLCEFDLGRYRKG